MLVFRKIEIEDKELITRYLAMSPSQQIVNCFEAFYLWRDIYGIEVGFCDGFAIFRAGEKCFFPYGNGDLAKAIAEIKGLKIVKATKENLALMGSGVEAVAVRNNFEYIYSADKFRGYKGSALQPKRNFVNYATKNYSWSYEPISTSNTQECKYFSSQFEGNDSFASDNMALAVGLDNFDKLSLSGGLIRIDGAIAAIFIIAPLCDGETAAGLFLRGKHELKGVIPLLYKEFFVANPSYKYVNLAEDLGIEGLRKNKLSYDPDFLLELYDVCG